MVVENAHKQVVYGLYQQMKCEYYDSLCCLSVVLSTCNEAVRDDMQLDSLQGRRDKAKLNGGIK